MTAHLLRLRASGRELNDALAEAFYGEFDGTIAARYGGLALHVVIDGEHRIAAARALVERIESALGVVVEGVDHDLVGIADVARRVSKTRQAVQLWVTGERGPGGFPTPVAAPGASRVWAWADVEAWLSAAGLFADEERPLPRTEATVVDGWLAARACQRDLAAKEEQLFAATAEDGDAALVTATMDGALVVAGAMTVEREIEAFAVEVF